MPVTQIPSREPSSSSPPPVPTEPRDLFEAQHWESAYRGFNPDDVPHLLIQLQDDLSRARKREAVWLSVILHLFVVILLWNADKLVALLPHRAVPLEVRVNPEKDATFLELPPDEQKVTRRPDSKIISDKDRIATSKTPQINRDELRKILQSSRPPAQQAPIAPQSQQAPPQMAQNRPQQAAPQQQPPASQQAQGFIPPQPAEQSQMQLPPQGSKRSAPNFNNTMTAGSAIEQAEQAAAANHGYGGASAGGYGLPEGHGRVQAQDQVQILTDTMGVDFGPYLTRVVQVVRQNWYSIMPPSVYPPILKQGKLAIEFVIQKDGSVAGMTLHTSSGDVALDRAAWGSITASNPFPPLPKEFPGQILGLRFFYFYNLRPDDLK
jgi:TonB family protein